MGRQNEDLQLGLLYSQIMLSRRLAAIPLQKNPFFIRTLSLVTTTHGHTGRYHR